MMSESTLPSGPPLSSVPQPDSGPIVNGAAPIAMLLKVLVTALLLISEGGIYKHRANPNLGNSGELRCDLVWAPAP